MTPVTCRAARALLNCTRKDLAAEAGVEKDTIMDFELGHKQTRPSTVEALRRALTKAGVIFLKPVGQAGSGVKLSRSWHTLLERREIGRSRTPPETLTPAVCRTGRALLGWTVEELGRESRVSDSAIARFELGGHTLIATIAGALRRCLMDHGVIFVEAVGEDGRGVRLSPSAEALRAPSVIGTSRKDPGTPWAKAMTPVTCRAARALLGWRLDDLVAAAGVCKTTVRLFEIGEQRPVRSTADAMRGALADAGVIFVEAVGDGGSGVRLSRSVEGLGQVGTIWRVARALLGWSFDELAAEAAVQRRTLLAIESGQKSALSTSAQAVRRALTSAGVIFLKPDRRRGRGVKLLRSAEALRELLAMGTWEQAKERIERYSEESGNREALRDGVAEEIRRRERLCGPEGVRASRRQRLRRRFEATGEVLERVSDYLRATRSSGGGVRLT